MRTAAATFNCQPDTLICSYSVIIEATHQFMIAEARMKGYLPQMGGAPARFLRENPEVVKSLRDYWTDSERIFSLNLLFLEAEVPVLRQAQIERESAGLRTIDSVIVSCMRLYGIPMLATKDRDFDSITGIQVFQPTDI
jgi:predicted nucleic acid-binding protein